MWDYTIKTTLDNKQTLEKIKKGAKKFEIQLLDELNDEKFNIEKAFDDFNKEYIDVISVHAPLNKNLYNETLYLETITNNNYKKFFIETCKLAQMFADYYKHPVNVIIHNGFRFENYLLIPTLINEIINIMNYVINSFPDIYIEIENVVPIITNENDIPYFCAGTFMENVDVVNYLNKNCNKPIFKTVLDVSHYLISINTINKIANTNITLEEIFAKHKNTIGTIHLANAKNFGIKYDEHGCGFEETKEDINFLKDILYYMDKYMIFADLCLEITEDDYYNVPCLTKTVEVLEKIKNCQI